MKNLNSFVQLPLPGLKVTTSTRIKRALRRAVRSEWFNFVVFLVLILGVMIYAGASS